jgi:hypothetical protein
MARTQASTRIVQLLVALAAACGSASAADYLAGPPQVIEGEGPITPGYGLDPRCRIIPSPKKDLVGDVSSFRPIAVCQSRGLYADSATIPNYWFPFDFYR